MKKMIRNISFLLLLASTFILFFSCKKMQRRAGLTSGGTAISIDIEKELYIKSFSIINYTDAMILLEHESSNAGEGLITIVVEQGKFDKNKAQVKIELFNPQATVNPASGSTGISSDYVISYQEKSMHYKTLIKEVSADIIATYIKYFTVKDLAGKDLTAEIDHADGLGKGKILIYLDQEELSLIPPEITLFNKDSDLSPKQVAAVDGLIYTVISGANTEKEYELSIQQRVGGDANLYIKSFIVPQALDVNIDHLNDQIIVLMEEGVLAANPNIIPQITLTNPSISKLNPDPQPLKNSQNYIVELTSNSSKYKKYTVVIKEIETALAAENHLHIKTFRFANNSGVIGVDIDHRQAGQDGHIIVTVQEGKWNSPTPTPRIDLYQPKVSELKPAPQILQDQQIYTVTKSNSSESKKYQVFVRELAEDLAQEVSLHIRDFSFHGTGSNYALGVNINHGVLNGSGIITVLVEEGKISDLPIPNIELYSLYATELNPVPEKLRPGQIYTVNLRSDRNKKKKYDVVIQEIPVNLAQEVSLYIKTLNFSPQDQTNILNINIDHDTNIISVEIQESSLPNITPPDVILFNPTVAELIAPALGTAFVDGLKYKVAVKTDHNKFKEYTVKIKEIDAVGAIERNVQMKSFQVAGFFGFIDHKNSNDVGEITLVLESNLTNNPAVVIPYNQFATVTPPAMGLANDAIYKISYQGDSKDYILKLTILQDDDLHIEEFKILGQIGISDIKHSFGVTNTGKITLAVEEHNLLSPTIVLKKPNLAEYIEHTRSVGKFYTVQYKPQYTINKTKAYNIDLTVIKDTDTQIESFIPDPTTYVAQVSIDHGTPSNGTPPNGITPKNGTITITVQYGTNFVEEPRVTSFNQNASVTKPSITATGEQVFVEYKGLIRIYDIVVNTLPNGACAIFTAQDFNDIRNNLTADCKLYKDINLSTYLNWSPIDNFGGSLDGQGFTISGLLINNTTSSNTGLFGDLKGEVKDLTLEIIAIQSNQSYTGSLAGTLSGNGKISQVTVTGGPIYGNTYVAGLVGYLNTNHGIEDVALNVSVIFASSVVGGLVGKLDQGTIKNSYVSVMSMNSTIATNVFGLVGQGPSTASTNLVINSYYPNVFTNVTPYGDPLDITTATQTTFNGWDFLNTWEWVRDGQWPRLKKKN